LAGIYDQLQAGVIDYQVIRLDLRIIARDLAEAVEEEAVGHLHYVRLVDRGDFLAPFAAGVIKRKPSDSTGGPVGNDFQTLNYSRNDLVFESGVEILGVLADDDEVDVLVAARDALERLDRPQVSVEIERFSKAYV